MTEAEENEGTRKPPIIEMIAAPQLRRIQFLRHLRETVWRRGFEVCFKLQGEIDCMQQNGHVLCSVMNIQAKNL
jgi:hypothetical protein